MSESYPIYRSIWESLDIVLFTKGVALAKEIASELNVSPKELISSLNTKERGKFTIIPDDDEALYQCQAIVQQGAVYMRCRCPTFGLEPRFCKSHQGRHTDLPNLPIVDRLVCDEDTYVVKDNMVYTLNGVMRGHKRQNKIILFEIESD